MTNSWSFLFEELYEGNLMSEHPDSIQLDSTAKLFEYEKMARSVDQCENVDELKMTLKTVLKLFMKYQETTAKTITMPMPR